MERYVVTIENLRRDMPFILRVQNVDDDILTQLQAEVGGYIESANYLFDDLKMLNIDCWVCDNKIGKPKTLRHRLDDGGEIDVHGNLCFATHDDEDMVGMPQDLACVLVAYLLPHFKGNVLMEYRLTEEGMEEWRDFFELLKDSDEEEEEYVAQA